MIYLYTAELCSKCITKKKEFKEKSIEYTERDAKRLKEIPEDYDDIDIDAFAMLCEQNMSLPVVVDDGK